MLIIPPCRAGYLLWTVFCTVCGSNTPGIYLHMADVLKSHLPGVSFISCFPWGWVCSIPGLPALRCTRKSSRLFLDLEESWLSMVQSLHETIETFVFAISLADYLFNWKRKVKTSLYFSKYYHCNYYYKYWIVVLQILQIPLPLMSCWVLGETCLTEF